MSATLQKIAARPWVLHVDADDVQKLDTIVTLVTGWTFVADPGCGVRGFDTCREALCGSARRDVEQEV